MPRKLWDEITYAFPNLNGCTVEVWEWISNIIPYFIMDVIHPGIKGAIEDDLISVWPQHNHRVTEYHGCQSKIHHWRYWKRQRIDGLIQDCGISGALAMEIPQSFTEPLGWLTTDLAYRQYRNCFFLSIWMIKKIIYHTITQLITKMKW